jgi:hypothetical protein
MQIVNLIPPQFPSMPRRILWALGFAMLLLGRTRAQSPTAGEYQVKAAFLFNFAKFVEWPSSNLPDPSAPLRICILGRDPFGEELRNITKEKTVSGRKLQIDQVVDLRQARTCQILFIASSEKAQLKETLEALQGANVLTVGYPNVFTVLGVIIIYLL